MVQTGTRVETARVWWRWYTAPAWWRVLEITLLFAVCFGLATRLEGPATWGVTAVSAISGGLLVGLLWGPERARARQRFVEALPPGTTPEQVRAAVRASRRGPVPRDPVVRVVATVLLRQRVDAYLGTRRSSLVVGALGALVAGTLAVTARPAWAVLAVVFLVGLVQALVGPRRLADRLVAVSAD